MRWAMKRKATKISFNQLFNTVALCVRTLLLAVLISLPVRVFSQAGDVSFVSHIGQQDVTFRSDALGNLRGDMTGKHKGSISVVERIDSITTFPNWPMTNIEGFCLNGGVYCYLEPGTYQDIVYPIGNRVYAWRADGSSIPGWPTATFPNGDHSEEGVSFGDIIGDGQGEVIVGTRVVWTLNGYLYAYKRDGTLCPGFPVNSGFIVGPPVLGDLDGDGKMEIVTIVYDSSISDSAGVYVYRGDGSIYPGWPRKLDSTPGSSCAVGDINGDGIPEIVAEGWNKVYAFDRHGNLLPGFPFTLASGFHNSYSSPVLVDLTGTGKRNIIFGTHQYGGLLGGYVYCLNYDGTVMPGWPQFCISWIYGPPSVGRINNTNLYDICVGVVQNIPNDSVYAWDQNGNTLPGFPFGGINDVNNQVTIADIDGDGNLELLFDDNTIDSTNHGKYQAYRNDGTSEPGWPLLIFDKSSFVHQPCLFDIARNGTLDFLGGAENLPGNLTDIYLWNMHAPYNPNKIMNPMWQFNARHNGVFGDYDSIIAVRQISSHIPTGFSLSQNFPNPFNPNTIVKFQIASYSLARLSIFDILGRQVATLVNETLKPGEYQVIWDGSNNASGLYFYRLRAGSYSETRKMVLLK